MSRYVLFNIQYSKYIHQKPTELKGEIDKSIIIVGDLNTSLSQELIEQVNQQGYEKLNIFNQLDLFGRI